MRILMSSLFGIALASFTLAACSHELTSPEPGIQAIAPDLVCNGPSVSAANGARVTLTGTDFTPMPSKTLEDKRQLRLPRVSLQPVAAVPGAPLPGAPIEIADDPAQPAASRVHWASETSMSFDVVPADHLAAGVFDVTVTNPDETHAAMLARRFAIIPPPIVTAAQPMAICDDQSNQTVVITGSSFLVYDGGTPTITIDSAGGPKTYLATANAADCAAIPGTLTEANAKLCTAITVVIPQGDLSVTAATMVSLVVTNPAPADCASSDAFQITLDAPPRVDSVVPATVCQGGAQLTIEGANFLPGAGVTLHCPGIDVAAGTVTINPTGTQIVATFGGGAPAGTACEVIVTNTDSCEDRPLPHKSINVISGPITFAVDPDVVYNGINTRITIYSTTITQPVVSVTLTMGAASTPLTFNSVPGFPNRLQAIVPAGQATGLYDLTVEDSLNCPTTLVGALTVTSETTVTLKNLVPPFGPTSSDTAVTLFRDTAAVAPNDHPFVETPRVFLNPHMGAPTDIAVPLESVAFLDGNRITGIVPAGTPVHIYDVVLVNPDGSVGVLDSGYTETQIPPPQIDSATPASIISATGQQVTLAGSGFGVGAVVTLSCVDSAGAPVPAPGVTSTTPACTGTACTQAITIDGSTLSAGSVCVVRVTNLDGTYGELSAIGVTNSSRNLSSPKAGNDMNVARRALSAGAGNATAANRYVYAIGGDAGTAPTALSSVEYAAVDIFGRIGAWTVQPTALRAPRTLAGAVTIGRYVYLVGGNDGTAPTATAERALILSPRESPQITDIDLQLAPTGLAAGTYRYRVAAVFSATDLDNPNGESLASDALTVKVPSFPGKQVVLTVLWRAPVDSLGAPLPNVVGYRIYRSVVDGGPGTETLIATTTSATPRTFVDNGSALPGAAVPLRLGTTGAWAALPSMGTAREGLAVAYARDPAVPNTLYVYALLGRSSATVANRSYELLPVTVAANGHQTAAPAWVAGTQQSIAGRWQMGAWTVDSTVSSLYASTTYVFVGGGLTAVGASSTKVEAAQVLAGGQLGPFDDAPKDMNGTTAGYGVCAANGQLFTFGGAGAAPSFGAQSATLISPPPVLANNSWNSEGLSMTHARYLLGSAVQSSFIFLLGGSTELGAASTSTELVIW